MALSTLKIRYDGTAQQFPLEINLGYRRYIRHTFVPGESYDVTAAATADELARDANFVALLTANTFAVVQTPGADEVGITLGQLAPVALAGTMPSGVPVVIRVAMASGGASGTADDVTVFSAASPCTLRILDAWAYISTAVGASTLQIRDTAAGAGTLMVSALASAANGLNRAAGTTPTVTSTIATNGSLFIRRSDRSVVGTMFLLVVKE